MLFLMKWLLLLLATIEISIGVISLLRKHTVVYHIWWCMSKKRHIAKVLDFPLISTEKKALSKFQLTNLNNKYEDKKKAKRTANLTINLDSVELTIML